MKHHIRLDAKLLFVESNMLLLLTSLVMARFLIWIVANNSLSENAKVITAYFFRVQSLSLHTLEQFFAVLGTGEREKLDSLPRPSLVENVS
ncbi:hypothetical protein [Schaalia sp. lx-260]|uniref:hypothetical protein n=1 Tax=Schaalia sp. lx-260 TaxID=2899082 RepID=UPI001E35E1E7|nr:hypothetical protein [Schaalia sp. lx-260]MCD4549590.1 hypothetical protein [Schaalia sp. lx-260]